MATEIHPETGVLLNVIDIKRPALGYSEAVTVHVMRKQGVPFADIAHRLGTNPARVGEVLRGDAYPQSVEEADKITEKVQPRLPV